MPRAFFHDYRSRCIYHITICKAPGIPDFGRLVGAGRSAAIERSPLGLVVARHIGRFPELSQKLRVLQYIVMPDHIHMLIFATERLELPLGNYIGMFKVGVGHDYRQGYGGSGPVFAEDFYDRILHRNRPLDTIYQYIRDNPYRLAVRRAHPDFFRRVSHLTIDGRDYCAYGNPLLLSNPFKEAVAIHRADSEEVNARRRAGWLHTAANGGVLVSPFISRPEKAVRTEAEALGGKIILLRHEPFPERFKPTGAEFAMCEAGRLLLVAPAEGWGEGLSRGTCVALNRLAGRLAATGA